MNMFRLIVLSTSVLASACTGVTTGHEQPIELLIGTFSEKGSRGVYATSFNVNRGTFAAPRLMLEATDPTYLALSRSGVAYGAMRDPGGRVTAFLPRIEGAVVLNHQSAEGDGPCYVSIRQEQDYLAVANYRGGNFSLFKLEPDGAISPDPQVVQHHGHGAHPERQTGPHPHWVEWSPYGQNLLYVVDLGLDQVLMYRFDPTTGQVGEGQIAFQAAPADGPRHLVFHPEKQLAYIVNELSNSVTLVEVQRDGKFRFISKESTLPADYSEHNQAAHIAISKNGHNLYVSNRGLNSIAVFRLDGQGRMELVENVTSGGDWPRFFRLLDEYGYLLVANRNSNNLVAFEIGEGGELQETGSRLSVPQPTFIGEYTSGVNALSEN